MGARRSFLPIMTCIAASSFPLPFHVAAIDDSPTVADSAIANIP